MKIKKVVLDKFLLQLLIISLYFGRINIDIGVTIKPYMIVTALIFFYIFKDIKIRKLYKFEIYMILFILVYSLTALKFIYPENHIRYILAFIVLMIFYFTIRSFFERISMDVVKEKFIYCTNISLAISLFYYFLGVFAASKISNWNNVRVYGVLLDRGIPRMIGFISDDPNIFVFFITIGFMYSLTNLKESNNNKLLAILSGACILLSFSRGAYLAIGISIIFIMLIKGRISEKIKSILVLLAISIGFIYIAKLFGIDIVDIVLSRFSNLLSDRGSGRIELWRNALKTFANNPIFGIGINSTIPYGISNYNNSHYVHNTLLEVMSEGGIISFSFLSIWIVSLYRYCFKIYKYNKREIFMLGSYVALVCQMIFLSILYNEMFYFFILLVCKFMVYFDKEVKSMEEE
ncbi:O-antigen ligase family protein [uncultured Clostridium sp.]|uniref:O-antigen ligase family protein n=1 Tax=uncultured Clostridium sp. TaxID=59620 RepID=UPI0025F56BC3|nr:O-antigen ligase family protein [uncultured Clostridium sp.]